MKISFSHAFIRSSLLCVCTLWLTACQSTSHQDHDRNTITKSFTGWPRKSVERLFAQYMESKEFEGSTDRNGTQRYDRKGSTWDSLKYGSFLEPDAWLRLEVAFHEERDFQEVTLRASVQLITHRLSSLEEVHPASRKQIQEVNGLLDTFYEWMLRPAFEPSNSNHHQASSKNQ